MKYTLATITLALLSLLALVATVAAEVPTLMNYQGRLTDAGGTPVADDTYEVTFRIYDEVPTIRWTEVHSISTTNGLFSVQLGSNGSPLQPTHFDYAETWLGIQITGESEITPRTRLTTVPYAFASGSGGEWRRISGPGGVTLSPVNNDYNIAIGVGSGSGGRLYIITDETDTGLYVNTVSSHPTADVLGGYFPTIVFGDGDGTCLQAEASTFSGTATGILAQATSNSGPAWAGRFESNLGVFGPGGGDTLVILDSTAFGSGAITSYGPGGTRNMRISSMNANPDYGALAIFNDQGYSRAMVYVEPTGGHGRILTSGPNHYLNVVLGANGSDANKGYLSIHDEAGDEQVSLYVDDPGGNGVVMSDQFIATGDVTGDASVILPSSSIHSDEILNEPGIASEQSASQSGLSSVSMGTLQTVTITIPDDGYILVQGKCYVRLYGTLAANHCSIQIDQTSGGGNLFPYVTRAGVESSSSSGDNYSPIFVSRIYQKSAGSHTFILEGKKDQPAGSVIAYHKILTAMYFPTSYGTVMAMSENPGDLPGATPVTALAGEEPGDYKTMYELDLRELELKAARLRAEAAQAERDLMKAQMQSMSSSATQE